MHILDELQARGVIKTSTDLGVLREAMDVGPVTFYIGFDPTGDSLHVGHLVQVLTMRRLQQAGHRPIVVLGGGTAMVGDPTGKDATRAILTREEIQSNVAVFRKQIGRLLRMAPTDAFVEGDNAAIAVNNADWLLDLGYISFLRDIGKHFSVNKMVTAEGTRQRLERNQGMSFIEFNYHLLQSYDYLELHRRHGCTLQVGGDDQWFNILGGVDLIRREAAQPVHAFTTPLITTADGKKMGKTEQGAVWIDPDKLSPYDYFQYWVNVQDADVGRFLQIYTDLDLQRIADLDALQGADIRQAKQVLATEATAMLHGRAAAEAAASAAKQAFSGGISEGMPSVSVALPVGLIDVLEQSGLCKSRGDARRQVAQGAVRLGAGRDIRVSDANLELTEETVVWRGKKNCVRVVAQ
jgi:tyrosyl-tRNA synthetase